ncbi:MAG: PEP/pyruvate-binding domain-containing protein [Deltaproteobacteria bacterium]|nr:PEP/pyruvate-binding domain-containing protein [Deltaproteobacteria bacterium]MDQ3296105.1 PEP/pyruvate-binding domain-containing protein [Myxococcota bacterium]
MKLYGLVLGLVMLVAIAPAEAREQRAWTKQISAEATWLQYSKTIASDRLGKFIIDLKTNDIYFIDVNTFNIHADFVLGILLKKAWTTENVREYNKNYERVKPQFILGYMTHHLKIDKWSFAFWEGDKIGPDDVLRARKRLEETFFIKNMPFRPDSPMQLKVAADIKKRGVPTITNDDVYKAASYQAFNKGRTVGKLKVVPLGTPYESLTFDRQDIVLLQESYPDITPVAGILATTFSTPLSHVNLRANAWGIPNAGDKKARAKFGKLEGKTVYYEVTETAVVLREATAAEIKELETKLAARKYVELPPAKLDDQRFAMLTRMRASDVSIYGTKSANLGEIVTANLEGVRVPAGFGVPFYYYVQHMKRHGLDTRMLAMIGDARFKTDAAWRKASLEELRKAIVAAPIDAATLDAIYKRVRLRLAGRGVFVRSSTNAEDLPGFNGAGLYDTFPNVRGKQAIGEAIKGVWASVWNLRAVDERAAFGIDHRQVYGAVLLQIGVDATAAGVLVTKNLWDPTDANSYTINAKWGLGMRVVEGQKVPEQIIFDPTNDGTKILSRADDPVMLRFDDKGGIVEIAVPGAAGVILSEERAKALAKQVKSVIAVFTHGKALDIEWVLEGEAFWIVQARPFVGG